MVSVQEFSHTPVLLQQCVDLLSVGISGNENPVVIDATLGLGGHSEAILNAFPTVKLVGIDRDKKALKIASDRLKNYENRFIPIHATYDQIPAIAVKYGNPNGKVNGILMDLGVSSMQLDDVDRGFSYARDTVLDMRMDQSRGATAQEILNTASAEELKDILWKYGEEKFARQIAREIVRRRLNSPISSTGELVDLVRSCIPAAARRQGGNPAKRTFQALRIAVNNELQILDTAIIGAIDTLAPGGVLVVESYQSLEDRIVKHHFRSASNIDLPAALPVQNRHLVAPFTLLTGGAKKAGEKEILENSRAQSVRLRAIRRTPEREEQMNRSEVDPERKIS